MGVWLVLGAFQDPEVIYQACVRVSLNPSRRSLRRDGCASWPHRCPCFPRGVGCILYEMATGKPLFPGSTVKEELYLIFRLLG